MNKDWLKELELIMARLRAPDGCPWDREQTHESLKKYLMEECAEVLDAIDEGNMDELKDELGDLLMNIFFQAQIANENKQFSIQDVAKNICHKMIRRHPHVFANEKADHSEDVDRIWQQVKNQEKGEKESVLDGIPKHLSNLRRAQSMQKKAAKVGFDWTDWKGSFNKIVEEINELKVEIEAEEYKKAEEEFGDLLFSMTNLARSLKFEADDSLAKANNKFNKRFRKVEEIIKKSDKEWSSYTLDQLDEIWDYVKKHDV